MSTIIDTIMAELRQGHLDVLVDRICEIFRLDMGENAKRRLLVELLDGKRDLHVSIVAVRGIIDSLPPRLPPVQYEGGGVRWLPDFDALLGAPDDTLEARHRLLGRMLNDTPGTGHGH